MELLMVRIDPLMHLDSMCCLVGEVEEPNSIHAANNKLLETL